MADLHLVAAPADETRKPSPIRIVLAEGHALLRGSLRMLLDAEDGIHVVAEADDLESARRHVHAGRPHVLLLDLRMMGDVVRETIAKLRARAHETQLVILTMDESPVIAQHLLACGALGVVLKDQANSELAPAVRAAACGEQYISPRIAARLKAALRRSLTEK